MDTKDESESPVPRPTLACPTLLSGSVVVVAATVAESASRAAALPGEDLGDLLDGLCGFLGFASSFALGQALRGNEAETFDAGGCAAGGAARPFAVLGAARVAREVSSCARFLAGVMEKGTGEEALEVLSPT